jgi:hypothetical protein
LRRVLIVKRTSGLFGYEVEELTHVYDDPDLRSRWPNEMHWNRAGQYPFSICDTPETAEHEARGKAPWLDDASTTISYEAIRNS